jgi:hypothetical protein
VFYGIPDLAPFARALTTAARRQVIVELAAHHPDGPTAADCVAALAEVDIHPEVIHWGQLVTLTWPGLAT